MQIYINFLEMCIKFDQMNISSTLFNFECVFASFSEKQVVEV